MVTKSSMPEFEEYTAMLRPLWESHWLTNMGIYHNELEIKLKKYLTVQGLSLFTNGHMALELVLQAFNIDGEVITTPFTFASTTHAIVRNGLKPVFADIRKDNFTIDTNSIEKLVSPKTVAIVPVHVYGNICDVDKIKQIADKYELKVIYDAAHAFGIRYNGKGIGEYGDASMFSFHATKVFHTIEGGAVCYKNAEIGEKLYELKNFGIQSEEVISGVGANAKMNEFQAAMGLCNLKHLETEIHKRKYIVEKYWEYLGDTKGIYLCHIPENTISNYAYFPVLFEDTFKKSRDQVYEELKQNNIYARKYFYPLTTDYNCYHNQYDSTKTPIAKYIAQRILTLPLYADLKLEQVKQICEIILH